MYTHKAPTIPAASTHSNLKSTFKTLSHRCNAQQVTKRAVFGAATAHGWGECGSLMNRLISQA